MVDGREGTEWRRRKGEHKVLAPNGGPWRCIALAESQVGQVPPENLGVKKREVRPSGFSRKVPCAVGKLGHHWGVSSTIQDSA